MKNFIISLRTFIWLTLLTGMIYPLLVTAIAQLTMAYKANGSLIEHNGEIVGSELIGQLFSDNKYFWGRPSAVNYQTLPSSGSNLGPISKTLKDAVIERQKKIMEESKLEDESTIPTELLFASGSGLDPHITSKAAHFQVDRIADARGWKENSEAMQKIHLLIDENSHTKWYENLGAVPYVNVLQLNIELDKLAFE